MSVSGGFFRANAIFRDQPNHSYFDKDFHDPQDCLYLSLNEIHPYFLQPEQQADKRGFENNTITDPRTQKPITQLCYDHTQEPKTKIFRGPKFSAMSWNQHVSTVKVLQALQDEEYVEDENLYKLESVRLKERQEFLKFAYEFNQSNKELMYKPAKKLLELYKKWYINKSTSLMLKYPPESYNTHLGLPHVRLCKNVLNNQIVTIVNQVLVAKNGHQMIWQDEKMNFKHLQYSIDSYMEEYINSQDLKDNLEDEIKGQFLENSKTNSMEMPLFYIPLESLLFLLTAGYYPDLPTEMLLEIKENDQKEGDFTKTIIMDSPLPSRHVGWHTYIQVVDHAALAFLSLAKTQKWVNCNFTEEQTNNEEDYTPEIKAGHNNSENENFIVLKISDYLQNCTLTPDKNCKFSKSLVKWELNPSNNEPAFQIYTSLTQPLLNKAKGSLESTDTLDSVFLKLEFKPQFGCEIMTKYEMLKEWFKLKLLQKSKSICIRLDVNDYQTLLQESLTLQKLEQNLTNIYHIDLAQLLTNLFEFLKMLYNMPPGPYMLRYNPKFKDKLMLCKPSREITQNTVYLHQLLQTDPTDFLFMSQQNFLPLSENLCSLMHLQHHIIPCAFRPSKNPLFQNKERAKQPATNLNDKDWIMKRVQKQNDVKEQQSKRSRHQRKKLQRSRRNQRKIAAQNAKIDEEMHRKEIEDEMELDCMILGT